MNSWVRASKVHPCPVCSRKKWPCCTTADGRIVLCRAANSDGRQSANGLYIHRMDDRRAEELRVSLAGAVTSGGDVKGANDQLAKIAFMRAKKLDRMPGDPRRQVLADQLGVSSASLRMLRVGEKFCDDDTSQTEWTIPELNGLGEVVGVSLRKQDGFKYAIKDSGGRGLVYHPETWSKGDGPILLVEGLSDTAAGLTMGLNAVGRPSNKDGVEHLIELLWNLPDDRLIVVVADDDRLKDGKRRKLPLGHRSNCAGCADCWPGVFGARITAEKLATALERPVGWAMPPGGAKDTRVWLNSQALGDDRQELGQRFLAGLLASLKILNPKPVEPPPIVQVPDDHRPVVSLADYRADLTQGRAEAWASKSGVFLDRSETGMGKTHADIQLVKQVHADGGQVLLSLPTHDQGLEVVGALQEAGVLAVKYPKRNTDSKSEHPVTCKNTEADLAEKLGLPVMLTACIGCKFNKAADGTPGNGWCSDLELNQGYISRVITASESPVVVATHARGAAQSLVELGKGRAFIAIHEDARPLLRPMDFLELDELDSQIAVLRGMFSNEGDGNFRYGEELNRLGENENKSAIYDFLKAAVDRLDQVRDFLVDADEMMPIPQVGQVPKGTEIYLWFSMKRQKRQAGGWRPILAILGGEAEGWVVVNEKYDIMGRPETVRKVQAVWQNPVPENAVVIISDATSDTETLKMMVGMPVTDITPGGRVAVVHRACQVPKDITKKTSSGTIKKILHGLFEQRPDLKRIGVICHREHVGAVQEVREESGRISRESYFGSGDDRASNSWHKECDAVVILGTPRPGGEAVRAELVRQGKQQAASKSEPGWSKYEWRGQDERGNPVLVKSLRYADSDWQAAFQSLCRANLVQAVGRARASLPDGVEVIVVSTEECGLPIRDSDRPWLADGPAEVLAFVREKWGEWERINKRLNRPVFLHSITVGKLADSNKRLCVPTDTERLIKPGTIAKALSMPAKTVNNHLVQLDRLGLVIRDGKRGCRPVEGVVDLMQPEDVTEITDTVQESAPESDQPNGLTESAATSSSTTG